MGWRSSTHTNEVTWKDVEKKAKKASQRKKLITSSSYIQISKEKVHKKYDKESFLVCWDDKEEIVI